MTDRTRNDTRVPRDDYHKLMIDAHKDKPMDEFEAMVRDYERRIERSGVPLLSPEMFALKFAWQASERATMRRVIKRLREETKIPEDILQDIVFGNLGKRLL